MEQIPKTIEELEQWYIDRNLPSENVTRFFIGKNYKGAKAFGIYKDEISQEYIVYKNKSDGTRAIRYRGNNEEYAVNELYKRLKEEIYNQKNNNPKNYNEYNGYGKTNYTGKNVELITPKFLVITLCIILFIVIALIIAVKTPKRGYYKYDDYYYYYQNGLWYKYNEYGGWGYESTPETLKDNYSNYYSSRDYYYSYGIDDFEKSIYYEEPSSSSDSSSSDDWDSGSDWDSDFTDWDSDW